MTLSDFLAFLPGSIHEKFFRKPVQNAFYGVVKRLMRIISKDINYIFGGSRAQDF